MCKDVKRQAVREQEGPDRQAVAADGLDDSADALQDDSPQLGDSSWLLSDSAYDGTGLRVIATPGGSAGIVEDVQEVTRYEASDDGSDSDVTALAPRTASNVDPEVTMQPSQAMDTPFDDLETPSLASATMQSMRFPTEVPQPSSLSTYLASTISSPKTRSQSSSSLASFPTDLLSEVSAVSVVDTDEAKSDVLSDDGESETRSIASLTGSVSELVMPRMFGQSGSSGASDKTSSSSDREQRTQASKEAASPYTGAPRLRFLIIGPNGTFACRPSTIPVHLCVVIGAQRHDVKAMLGYRSSRSRRKKDRLPGSTSLPSEPEVAFFEGVPSLKAAHERVLDPFETLKTLLQPDLTSAEASLVDSVLPFLLENASAVDACFWIINPERNISLAQHVSGNYTELRRLCKLATVFPIMSEDLVDAEVNATSQLVQGDLEMWGLGKDGQIANLRKRAKVLVLTGHHRNDEGLQTALRHAQLRSKSVELYRRWSSVALPPPRPALRQTRTLRSGSTRQTNDSDTPTPSGLITTNLPSSLSSSALASPSRPEAGWVNWRPGNLHNGNRGLVCRTPHFDPLSAASLFHLVGLRLAQGIASFRSCFSWLWRQGVLSAGSEEARGAEDEGGAEDTPGAEEINEGDLGVLRSNEAVRHHVRSDAWEKTGSSWGPSGRRVCLLAVVVGVALMVY